LGAKNTVLANAAWRSGRRQNATYASRLGVLAELGHARYSRLLIVWPWPSRPSCRLLRWEHAAHVAVGVVELVAGDQRDRLGRGLDPLLDGRLDAIEGLEAALDVERIELVGRYAIGDQRHLERLADARAQAAAAGKRLTSQKSFRFCGRLPSATRLGS
jgi:hypothetical protein